MTFADFLNILKQNGPIVAVLLGIIWYQWRHIDKLLDRNAEIYEGHIKVLHETQERLLTKLIGPQQSSQDAPTMKQLTEAVSSTTVKSSTEEQP